MKIDTNSWHYKIMTYYKWSRKTESDWSCDSGYFKWKWDKHDKGELLPEEGSLERFRQFMEETGTYQPVDFCTYWRNVLVWPGLFAILWLSLLIWVGYMLSFVTIGGAGIMLGTILGVIAVFAAAAGLIYGVEKAGNYFFPKIKDAKDGFFDNVGKAMRNPELCTLVEYTNEKDAA